MDKLVWDALSTMQKDIAEIKTQIGITNVILQRNTEIRAEGARSIQKVEDRQAALVSELSDVKRVQDWWTITGKLMVILIPGAGIILKMTGVV